MNEREIIVLATETTNERYIGTLTKQEAKAVYNINVQLREAIKSEWYEVEILNGRVNHIVNPLYNPCRTLCGKHSLTESKWAPYPKMCAKCKHIFKRIKEDLEKGYELDLDDQLRWACGVLSKIDLDTLRWYAFMTVLSQDINPLPAFEWE